MARFTDTSSSVTFTAAYASVQNSAGADTLDELTDVTITSAASGDILRHNGTAWVDAAGIAASDVTSGAFDAARLATGTATDSYVVKSNAGTPTWEAIDVSEVDGAVDSSDGTVTDIRVLTQAAYDAIGTPSATTLYVISG